MASFLHVREHWDESRGGDTSGRVVLSELPRGDSPVACSMRCLNFVLDGVEQYEIKGRTVIVRAGEFILVEAGTTARAMLPLRQVTRGLCVYLPNPPEDDGASPFGDAFRLTTADGTLSRQLRDVAARLALDPASGPAIAEQVIQQAAAGLEVLTRQLAPRLMRIDAARPATRRDLLEKMEAVRRYLHDHPHRSVPLSELADVAAMSPFHLARTFRAVFDVAPADYHRRLRIQMADRELTRGHLSLGQVAVRFGFSEASSFCRAYRRILGRSHRTMSLAEQAE